MAPATQDRRAVVEGGSSRDLTPQVGWLACWQRSPLARSVKEDKDGLHLGRDKDPMKASTARCQPCPIQRTDIQTSVCWTFRRIDLKQQSLRGSGANVPSNIKWCSLQWDNCYSALHSQPLVQLNRHQETISTENLWSKKLRNWIGTENYNQ